MSLVLYRGWGQIKWPFLHNKSAGQSSGKPRTSVRYVIGLQEALLSPPLVSAATPTPAATSLANVMASRVQLSASNSWSVSSTAAQPRPPLHSVVIVVGSALRPLLPSGQTIAAPPSMAWQPWQSRLF